MKNPEFGPLTDLRSIIKGVVSGSLVIGSILNELGFAVQAVLFVIGIIVFLDSIIPFGKEAYILTTVIFVVIGGLLSLVLSLTGLGVYWILIAVILGVAVYLQRALRLAGKVKK